MLGVGREERTGSTGKLRGEEAETQIPIEEEATRLRQNLSLGSQKLYAEVEKKAAEVLLAAKQVQEAMGIVQSAFDKAMDQEKATEAPPMGNGQAFDTNADRVSLDFLIMDHHRLTLRVLELEGMLELANRKIAFYESFDDSIRDAVAHSLRVAFEVRDRAEREAKDLLDRARDEKETLAEEVAGLKAERDALVADRDALQKSVEELRKELSSGLYGTDRQMGERAQLLDELTALESRLRSVRREIESLAAGEPRASEVKPKELEASGSGRIPATVGPAQQAGEVELVISPVLSFRKLVELERVVQDLPEVKSFYVRDFHHGVATLLVRLSDDRVCQGLLSKLEELPGWNLVILDSSPHRIEARIQT